MTVLDWVDKITAHLQVDAALGDGPFAGPQREMVNLIELWLRDCMNEDGIADKNIEGTP